VKPKNTPAPPVNGQPSRIADVIARVMDGTDALDLVPEIVTTMWPATEKSAHIYEIIRTPRTGLSRAYVISHAPVTVTTHWWGGRTQPCTEGACPACQKAVRRDQHSYLFIAPDPPTRAYLLELTPGPTLALRAVFRKRRTLRGIQIKLTRRAGRPNGAVILDVLDDEPTIVPIPAAPSILDALKRLWKLTGPSAAAVIERENANDPPIDPETGPDL